MHACPHTDGDKPKEAADFAVEFEHRSSDKLKRGDVIDIVAKAVPQPPYKVRTRLDNSSSVLCCAALLPAAVSVRGGVGCCSDKGCVGCVVKAHVAG
jgi:hypothetical protein